MNTAWPGSGWGVAVIGAASLHVLVATVALSGDLNGTGASPATARPEETTRITVAVRPVTITPPSTEAAAEPATEPSSDVNPEAAPLSEQLPSTPTAPSPALLDAATVEGPRHFNVGEVETPAVPLPDWQVDVALLIDLGVRSFSVEVLIDATGATEHCALTRIEPDQLPDLRDAVAAKLCETVLRPAMRRGIAVPSVRHIELVLATP